MEQSQPLSTPITGMESQNLKKNNTVKIIAGITSVVAVAGIVFGIFEVVQVRFKDQQISELKHQIESYKTNVSNDEVDSGKILESNSAESDSSSLYNYRYGDGTTVSFMLPQNWSYIETRNEEGSCATKGCLNLILAPDAYIEQAANYNGFYVDMRLLGQYDGTPSLVAGTTTNYDGTPKSLIETCTGLYMDEMIDNDKPINGYPTYYRKISNNSYVDINFVIQNDKYDVLVANSRIESWHYSFPEHEIDKHEDYNIYEKYIEQIMKSIKFSQ